MGRPLTVIKHPREPEIARAFGVRLTNLYNKRGFKSYEELAREIGQILKRETKDRKTPSTALIGEWLRGERTPTLVSHMAALCEIFNVPWYDLFLGKESIKPKEGFLSRLLHS